MHRKHIEALGLDVRGRIYISSQGMNAQYGGTVEHATAYAEWVKQQPGFHVSGVDASTRGALGSLPAHAPSFRHHAEAGGGTRLHGLMIHASSTHAVDVRLAACAVHEQQHNT